MRRRGLPREDAGAECGSRIKAGVFAHVEIEPAQRGEVLLAPRDALRVEEGRTRLLAVRDGRVEALPSSSGCSPKTRPRC